MLNVVAVVSLSMLSPCFLNWAIDSWPLESKLWVTPNDLTVEPAVSSTGLESSWGPSQLQLFYDFEIDWVVSEAAWLVLKNLNNFFKADNVSTFFMFL